MRFAGAISYFNLPAWYTRNAGISVFNRSPVVSDGSLWFLASGKIGWLTASAKVAVYNLFRLPSNDGSAHERHPCDAGVRSYTIGR